MATLSFMDKLNEEQLKYAAKVGTAAKAAGVPPQLAISIAYHESRLNPNIGNGTSGEIGLMQVKPSTGKMLGVSDEDLRDPDKNIATGIKYLKQALKAVDGDPALATIGYNAGIDSKAFTGGDIPEITKQYLKAMKGYGAYQKAPEDLVAAPAADAVSSAVKDTSGAANRDRMIYGGMGAAAGLAPMVAGNIGDVRTQRAVKRAGLEEAARETARINTQRLAGAAPAVGAPAGGLPTPGVPAAPSISLGAPTGALSPPGGVIQDAGYLAKGNTGVTVYNTSKALGFTDTEAAEFVKKGMTQKDVNELAQSRRSAGFSKIRELFPSETWAENPQHSGLVLPEKTVGGVAKSFVQDQAIPASPELPEGRPAQLRQLPAAQPVSFLPPPPPPPKALTGLEAVTNLFRDMMGNVVQSGVGRAATQVLKYTAAPLGGLSAGLDIAEIAHESQKPKDQQDLLKMGLLGTGVAGGALSMTPKGGRIGIPIMIGSAGIQYARDNQDLIMQKLRDAQQAAQGIYNRDKTMPSDLAYSNPMGDQVGP